MNKLIIILILFLFALPLYAITSHEPANSLYLLQAPPHQKIEAAELRNLDIAATLENGYIVSLMPEQAHSLSAKGLMITKIFEPVEEFEKRIMEQKQSGDAQALFYSQDNLDYSSFIGALVSGVSETGAQAQVQTLQDFSTRYSYTSQCRSAEQYVYDLYQDFGLSPEKYAYQVHGYNCNDVIGTQTGTTYPDRIYVICGHLDSITDENPWSWAPGADDNASGSGGVLMAAKILSNYEFKYTIKYICFTGEEQGLYGSYYWVRDAYYGGDDIYGAINLDMIAFKDNSNRDIEVYTDNQTASKAIADKIVANAGMYSNVTGYKVIDPEMSGSDHYYFWYYGYPAVLGIERATSYWNPYYHTSDDIVSNCDFDLMAGTVKASMASLIELAVPDTARTVNVNIVPENTTLKQGETLKYTGNIVNNRAKAQTVEVWANVTLPNGQPYSGNPVVGPTPLNLGSYRSILGKSVSHKIPGNAPKGSYKYTMNAGTYPGTVIDSDMFQFTVQ